jgi:PAS domain S-box-containing protein
MLASPLSMALLVGPTGVLIYNDSYADFAGDRHPAILGLPAEQAWPEAAAFNRHKIDTVLAGETVKLSDERLELNRNGDFAAVYLDLFYGPILDDAGTPIAVLGTVLDTTGRVLAERQLRSSQQMLSAARDSLADNQIRFATLADTMPQMVWSTLPDGYHDYYNARWYEFTGVPAGSTDGEAWNGMFHPDDQERAWSRWRHSLATGEPYQIEYRLRHRTGHYRWTLGRALPIRDALGRITRWIGTCTDIHEARLAAEEREVVAQELSHRIKNIFSVIIGIVGLSARSYPEIKPLADQLRQRIMALGQAHDFVRPHTSASRPDADQRSLQSLVRQLLAPYLEDDDPVISFEGSDAVIDEGAATPLALLFHELATNSAKYGALSIRGGRVAARFRADGNDLRITWQESGGPAIAAPPDRHGFGSRLIALSVEGQMHGTVERHWEHAGLRVELSVPLTALSRSGRLKS